MNAEEVINGSWAKTTILFIIPGGADLLYCKKLNGRGNEIIRKYVMEGGSFLGTCAGGYYASSYVEFDKGGHLEVTGFRELGFFENACVGPVLSKYDYETRQGARAAKIYGTTFHDHISLLQWWWIFSKCSIMFKHAHHSKV